MDTDDTTDAPPADQPSPSPEEVGQDLVIIIPTRGLGELLRGTLDALRVQTCRDFEVVVALDAAPDATPDWLAEEFPFVELLRLPSRGGFAGTVNAALRSTDHPMVMLLNDDARPAPDCIFRLLDAAGRHPDFHGFATRICYHYSPRLLESAGDGFSLAGRGFHRGWRQTDGPPFDREEEVFGACAAAALYRRELFTRVGLFEEEFFAVHEDVDLAFRARRRGMRFLYVPSARVVHKGSATLGRKSGDAVYYDSRNSELLLLKNVPLTGFLRMLPWYALYTYHNFLCAVRGGRLLPWLSGKLAVLPRLPRMLRRGALVELEATVPFTDVAALFDPDWHRSGVRRVLADPRALTLAILVPLALTCALWLALA